MTTIKIFKNKGSINGFEISGHSGYARAGRDIVCAAVSSISGYVCLGIVQVLGVEANFKRDDKKGYLFLRLPKEMSEKQKSHAETLLETFEKSMEELVFDYGDYIRMEVQDEIY